MSASSSGQKQRRNRSVFLALIVALIFIVVPLSVFTVRFMVLQQDNSLLQSDDLASTESQQLFKHLMAEQGLIKIVEDGQLILPPKDEALARKVRGEHLSKNEATLFERLYESIAGKAVQHQIGLWNHTRRFAAVRDNFSANNEQRLAWQARQRNGSGLTTNAWVSLNYGYVNGGRLLSGFNDWVSASSRGADNVIFHSRIHLSAPQSFTLQVIGWPDIKKLPGRKQVSACYPLTEEEQRRGQYASCDSARSINDDASAYEIRLQLSAGTHELILPVKSVINPEKKVNGLPIQQVAENQFIWNAEREWQYNPVQNFKPSFGFVIRTRDGIALTETRKALPTEFTRDNGLLTLVGYDKSDRFALSGIVSRSALPNDETEVRLTLDSTIQRLSQEHLLEELSLIDKQNKYTRYRRAGLVIMDAQTGAILAAANAPNPPAGIHFWDRASFSRLYPNSDPFSINSWQGLDNHNSPGSTFKVVTALGALRAMEEGREDLQQMIEGLGKTEFRKLTGLSFGSYSYHPGGTTTTIKNSSNYVIGKAAYRPLRAPECADKDAEDTRSNNLGMRESVRDSLNTWFARLGVMMDRQNLDDAANKTELMKIARTLDFEGIVQLADDSLPLARILGGRGRGDVLNGYTGTLSLAQPALGKPLQRLAQNSFGQGVAATPMQMARVAASVATAEIPTPHLIAYWNGDKVAEPEKQALRINNLHYLRQGMKAVPEVGTARRAFNDFYKEGRCRVYGKTGTAQISRSTGERFNFNTAWFVGWRENEAGQPDLSFACMVTHTYVKGRRNGGNVCGPVIARILHDLDKQEEESQAKSSESTEPTDDVIEEKNVEGNE